jgi:hypothetical protein
MNRSIISVLFVLIICVVAVGFYRGWFTLSRGSPAAGSNKVNVNLTLDKDKVQEDVEMVKNKATELTGKGADPAKGSGHRTNDSN